MIKEHEVTAFEQEEDKEEDTDPDFESEENNKDGDERQRQGQSSVPEISGEVATLCPLNVPMIQAQAPEIVPICPQVVQPAFVSRDVPKPGDGYLQFQAS